MLKKVMIIDDNHLSVEGINTNINWKYLGCQVTHMQFDASSALELLNSEDIDLLISDIQMPGMTGLELMANITPINDFMKVIFITAYDKFEYAKEAIRLGAFDFIEKPIDYTYLTQVIKNAISKINEEVRNLELLNKSWPALTEKFFSELIFSNKSDAYYNLSSYLPYVNQQLDCSLYCVLIIQIENSIEIKSTLSVEKYHLLLISLSNYINSLINQFSLSYLLHDLNGFVCILGTNYKQDIFQSQINDIANQIIKYQSSPRLNMNVSIGHINNNLWNIGSTYKSASNALEYRFYYPNQNIFDARDALNKDVNYNLLITDLEDELIRIITKKNKVEIENWIDKLTLQMQDNFHNKKVLYIYVHSLLSRLLKYTYEMGIEDSNLESEIKQMYLDLESFKSLVELFTKFKSICLNICLILEDSIKTCHDKICESAIQYIQQRYEESELSLNEIADFVSISPTYLSALFKRNTGENISDIITSIRIEKSCQLLVQTKLTLREISEKVGYANQYYFSSSFKKRTGTTPSKYRSTNTKS